MTGFDFEGNDWDEITEAEKRNIVDRLVASRDALSDDYETLAAEHDLCPDKLAAAVDAETHAAALRVTHEATHGEAEWFGKGFAAGYIYARANHTA